MECPDNNSVSALSDLSPPNETEATDHSSFQKRLRLCLQRHRLKELHLLFTDQIWQRIADDIELMWDVNSLLFLRLRTLNRYRFRTFEACQQLLIRLASVCNPKEVLIAFLAELESQNTEDFEDANESNAIVNEEELSSFDEEVPYRPNALKAIFKPIRILIGRFATDHSRNLDWALNSLYSELYRINLPSVLLHDEMEDGAPTNSIRGEDTTAAAITSKNGNLTTTNGKTAVANGAKKMKNDDSSTDESYKDDDQSSQASSLYTTASIDSSAAAACHMSYQFLDFLLPDYVELLNSFVQPYRRLKLNDECDWTSQQEHEPPTGSQGESDCVASPSSSIVDEEEHVDVKNETDDSSEGLAPPTSSDDPIPESSSNETDPVESKFKVESTVSTVKQLQDDAQNGRFVMLRAFVRILNWPLTFLKNQRYLPETDYSMLSNGRGHQFKGWTLSKEQLLTQIKTQNGRHLNVHKMSLKIAKQIATLEPNLFSFCADPRWLLGKSAAMTELQEQFADGIGLLAFVSFVLDSKPGNFVPSVHSPSFMFQAFLPYINQLIRVVRPCSTPKGLRLALRLLSNMSDVPLQLQFRELDVEQERIEMESNLLRIMTYSNREPLRKLSLKVFRCHMKSLNNAGRYQRIYSLINSPYQFVGTRSFMLTLYKHFLFTESDLTHLAGNALHKLVRCMSQIILKQLQIEINQDTVLTFLNLIRFLVMWDPRDVNRTQIWNIAPEIKKDFLEPLQQTLILSRRQYQLELKRVQEKPAEDESTNNGKKAPLSEWNYQLKMPADVMEEDRWDLYPNRKNIEAIQKLICSNDLIESVLVRVIEIISTPK
jgi:hypothetical protein